MTTRGFEPSMRTKRYPGLLLALAVVAAAVFMPNGVSAAANRSGAVLATGQVIMAAGPGAAGIQQGCGENEDLVFTFTETAAPSDIELQRSALDGAASSITVVIDEVCEPGQATFEYEHRAVSGDGEIGVDLSADPAAPRLSIPIESGASQTLQVAYQVLEADDPGAGDKIDKIFALAGTRIGFLAGQVAGQATRDQTLVTIALIEDTGPPLPPDRITASDERIFDAGGAFNQACESAEPGSSFADACAVIAAQELTDEQIRQVALAFDAHELAAIPTASSEGGRIQGANVNARIAELRSGATGLSLSGVALAFNGELFDAGWLPLGQVEGASGGGGGGSTLFSEKLGMFVNGKVSLGDRNRRGKEVGFDFDSWGVTAGIDYRFDTGTFAGVSLGYSEYDADLDQDGGSTDAETITVQGYGSYSVTQDFYLDATLGYSTTDVRQRRVVDLSGIGDLTRTIARGSTDARQISASLAVNYRLPLDTEWSITPYGEFQYAWNDIDGFSERGSPFALTFDDQDFGTETAGVGFRITRAFSFSRGVLSPFVDGSFRHESGNDGYLMQPRLVEASAFGPDIEINSPDRNFGRLDAGASWVFLAGTQLFVSYSTLVAESDTTRHSIFLGVRGEF